MEEAAYTTQDSYLCVIRDYYELQFKDSADSTVAAAVLV